MTARSYWQGNGVVGVGGLSVGRGHLAIVLGIHNNVWSIVVPIRRSVLPLNVDKVRPLPSPRSCWPAGAAWSPPGVPLAVTISVNCVNRTPVSRLLTYVGPPFTRFERGPVLARGHNTSAYLFSADGRGNLLIGINRSRPDPHTDADVEINTDRVVEMNDSGSRQVIACTYRDTEPRPCPAAAAW
jgi:hypothetical protein